MAAADLPDDPRLTRLSNRAAMLAFAAAFAIVAALVALPTLLQEGELAPRGAALAAVILAVAMTAWAGRARAALRAALARPAGSRSEASGERAAVPPAGTAARDRRAHPRKAGATP